MLSREHANALLLSLTILCMGLGALSFMLWKREPNPHDLLEHALSNDEVRGAVVEELVAQSSGVYDSHPDPLVGRVLQPKLENRSLARTPLNTNEWGMREGSWAMPKEDGVLRVVLLGDSYVHGNGVHRSERVGAHLEAILRQRSKSEAPRVEVLHVGIPSWNILAECAFARRQLGALKPDLLVQVIVPNDLDDMGGVRGFGSTAAFTPQRRERGTSMVHRTYPRMVLGFSGRNYLLYGLDHESRSRYREAREAIAGLRRDVVEEGGSYCLLLNWMAMLPVGMEQFASAVQPDELVPLPFSFFENLRYRVSARDGHWNRAGHLQIARLLYHHIQTRQLMEGLGLEPWADAQRIWDDTRADVESELASPRLELERPELSSAIDLQDLEDRTARQIYGGLRGPEAGPYASLILASGDGSRLLIEGSFPPDRSLSDATSRVYADQLMVGEIRCRPGEGFRFEVDLPTELSQRPYFNVRLESEDFVYKGPDFRKTVSLYVHRVAVE